jgi:hypothetical protein
MTFILPAVRSPAARILVLALMACASAALAAEPPAQPMEGAARTAVETPATTQPDATPAPATDLSTTPTPSLADSGEPWRFEITTWLWLMSTSGDVGAKGLSTNLDASFGEILDESDSVFAFSGRLEVGKGKWGGYVDGTYTKIGVNDQPGIPATGNFDATSEMAILDIAATYRVGDWQPTGDAAKNRHRITLDLLAGGRFRWVDLTLTPTLIPERSRGISWIDPIVGADFVLPLSERWRLETAGDIGGFGVSSDLTWSARALLGYDFTLFNQPATIFAGYRAIGDDYSTGSGTDKFTWDVIVHGPILGFALKF